MAHAPVTRALGGLPTLAKDHLYAIGGGGLLYTSPWIVTEPTARYYATILLAAAPFEVRLAGTTGSYDAVALKQMTKRAVRAVDVSVMSFQLDPSHPHFPRFRGIARPGLLVLKRATFARLGSELVAAYRGQLSAEQARRLHETVVETVLPLLPPCKTPDARVRHAIELLWRNHNSPPQALAAAVGLSYSRLSHLFVESMGLSLRMYQRWRKVRKAMTLLGGNPKRRLTDIAQASGFTDSSHLCNALCQAHGAPPSHFLNPDYVRIVSVGRHEDPAEQRHSGNARHTSIATRPRTPSSVPG